MEAITHTRSPKMTKFHFSRLLYRIANLINDRPIGVGRVRVSKIDADRIIRPNDLLLGRSSADITPLIPAEACDGIRGSPKYIELLRLNEAFVNMFWVKFHQQMFLSNVPREKWFSTGRQPAVGDEVLIRDTNPVRGLWFYLA